VNSLASSQIEVGWNVRAGPEQFVSLLRRVALAGASPSRTGSGALALAYVAAGRRDGFLEHHINAWDCLAGILLVEEAGGYVSDYLRGDGLKKGNALIACAAGVKDALIEAAAFEGVTA
jgi:myo-inositol-1(or 4)-monophosphatase